MRVLMLVVLSLGTATMLTSRPATQSSPPTIPTPPKPQGCYELRTFEVVGADHRWARVLTGDEWIAGCIGSAGKCYAPIWFPC